MGKHDAVRSIEIEDGLSLRFPRRSADFAEGVEIGILAAFMALRHPFVARDIATASLIQARVLAESLGYRLTEEETSGELTRITLTRHDIRPRLRLVSSA